VKDFKKLIFKAVDVGGSSKSESSNNICSEGNNPLDIYRLCYMVKANKYIDSSNNTKLNEIVVWITHRFRYLR
jgi:hypothetical protein